MGRLPKVRKEGHNQLLVAMTTTPHASHARRAAEEIARYLNQARGGYTTKYESIDAIVQQAIDAARQAQGGDK